MSDWNKIVEEKVSDKHRDNVFAAASAELKEIRLKERRGFLAKVFGVALGTAAAAVGVVMVERENSPVQTASTTVAQPNDSGELVLGMDLMKNQDDLDTIADLDVLEDLEVLEQWEPS